MLKPEISQQHLIVFTRYPEVNRTKTRLIPLLGAEGAANLQRQMTEHTISQVAQLSASTIVSSEVRFAGGNLQLMQTWLGANLLYTPQGEGDLGERMMRSLNESFDSGAKKVIIIGTDCPDIDSELLQTAFERLNEFDLVLGPAIDGGYYLIGLRRFAPELFSNIDWGTSQVFQQTIDIAQILKLSSFYLPPLADIDRPEDLKIWEEARKRGKGKG